MVILCQIRILKLVARTQVRLLRWFNGGPDDTALLPLLLFKIMSVRFTVRMLYMNDRTFGAVGLAVFSGLGCRYTYPGRWMHLPFRGH